MPNPNLTPATRLPKAKVRRPQVTPDVEEGLREIHTYCKRMLKDMPFGGASVSGLPVGKALRWIDQFLAWRADPKRVMQREEASEFTKAWRKANKKETTHAP